MMRALECQAAHLDHVVQHRTNYIHASTPSPLVFHDLFVLLAARRDEISDPQIDDAKSQPHYF